jgi:hypothetical protein
LIKYIFKTLIFLRIAINRFLYRLNTFLLFVTIRSIIQVLIVVICLTTYNTNNIIFFLLTPLKNLVTL